DLLVPAAVEPAEQPALPPARLVALQLRDFVSSPRPFRLDVGAMHILFFTSRPEIRHFIGAVQLLAAEGHEVVIASPRKRRGKRLPRPLRETERVRLDEYDEVSHERFGEAILLLRHARNYAWYL